MKTDYSVEMDKTELIDNQGGNHLRHVFNDDTKPTGNPFCINAIALHLKERSLPRR